MRRVDLVIVLTGLAGVQTAAAQDFSWLLGRPSLTRRSASTRRPSATSIGIPLPIPRPRFPSDMQIDAASVTKPAETAVTDASVGEVPPLPPERPPEAELDPTLQPQTDHPGSPAALVMPKASKPEADEPAGVASPASPTVAASGATKTFDPRAPLPDPGCTSGLATRGVVAETVSLGPQPDARCTVVQPMRLVSATLIDGNLVTFPDKPTIACVTAHAFTAYVHDLLGPLVKGTYGVELASVWTGPGLECRSRDHIFGAKLSAHGQGLAIDIAEVKLSDGRIVAVGEPKSDVERDFETAARAGGCGYFHTVLGPGSDSYHRTHWHFDLEVRGKDGDGKYCK